MNTVPEPGWALQGLWGSMLLAADTGGTLYVLDALTGREVWTYDTGSPLASTPFVSGGALYLTTVEGALLRLR